MSSPVRILALCGYSQNAITFAASLRGALLQAPDFNAAAAWKPLSGAFQKFQLPSGAAEQGERVGSVTSASKDGRAEFTFLDPPIVLGREHLAPVHVKEYEKNLKEAENKHHVTPRAWWLAPDRDTYAGECRVPRGPLVLRLELRVLLCKQLTGATHQPSRPSARDTTDTPEYDNSVKYISDFLQMQERPFDGVIGFSQGAAMTAALTALVSILPLTSIT